MFYYFFFTNITSMNSKCLNANLILLITSLCGAAAAPLVRVEVPGECWPVRQPVEVAQHLRAYNTHQHLRLHPAQQCQWQKDENSYEYPTPSAYCQNLIYLHVLVLSLYIIVTITVTVTNSLIYMQKMLLDYILSMIARPLLSLFQLYSYSTLLYFIVQMYSRRQKTRLVRHKVL